MNSFISVNNPCAVWLAGAGCSVHQRVIITTIIMSSLLLVVLLLSVISLHRATRTVRKLFVN